MKNKTVREMFLYFVLGMLSAASLFLYSVRRMNLAVGIRFLPGLPNAWDTAHILSTRLRAKPRSPSGIRGLTNTRSTI